jgi:hypothetical protein
VRDANEAAVFSGKSSGDLACYEGRRFEILYSSSRKFCLTGADGGHKRR